MNMDESNVLLKEMKQIMESGHGKFNYWSEKIVSRNQYDLQSGIVDVGQGINVAPWNFFKKNKHRPLNKPSPLKK